MNALLARVPDFFVANFPSLPALLIGGPLGLAWSFAALGFALLMASIRAVRFS